MKFIRLKDELDGYGWSWMGVCALLVIFIMLGGCATMPAGVMIVEQDQIDDCIALGMVSNDALHDMTVANATADMLNAAKKRGANSVVMQQQAGSHFEISMVGSAYYCDWNRPK